MVNTAIEMINQNKRSQKNKTVASIFSSSRACGNFGGHRNSTIECGLIPQSHPEN